MSAIQVCSAHARIQRRDKGSGPPVENNKVMGYFSNTGPDTQEDQKVTKPAFNVGLSSAR